MKQVIGLLGVFLINIQLVLAQAPQGYYDSADGLTGENLRTALKNIIDGHYVQSYSSLWGHFHNTDKKANGKVWDMYSTKADGTADYEYTFGTDQCGNYSSEGSCYNREHSFPKSWFSNGSPMKTDLFHLYPTDGKVNGKRSNYPYGEVIFATWTSTNGSKLGSCSYPGYTGIVFEPIDEFKGDFARTYFYMLTRYKDKISNWNSPMLFGNNLASWAEDMLVEWHQQDPVSQKEIDRNNAVYQIQNNRNPYIDNPDWVIAVWKPEQVGVSDLSQSLRIWYHSGNLNWDSSVKFDRIDIYNVLGQKVQVLYHLEEKNHQLVDLSPSVYFAKIEGQKNMVVKFVVR